MPQVQFINYINADTREIERRKKSPQHGKITDIGGELYYFRDFFDDPRFSLVILMMEAEQYKRSSSESPRRRQKYKKYELIPVSLLRAHLFSDRASLSVFIPEALPPQFTVKDYSRVSKIRGRVAYSTVKTLTYLGFFEEAGKIGRATAYKIK